MSGFDFMVTTSPLVFREQLIQALANVAATTLLEPNVPKKPAEIVGGLKQALIAYEEIVQATSSSNSGYEFRDLPDRERDTYEKAKHLLRLLSTVHGST